MEGILDDLIELANAEWANEMARLPGTATATTKPLSATDELRMQVAGNTRSQPKLHGNYKCEKCRGTGRVCFGYVNIRWGKCFACNGAGFFRTSPEQRAKAREQRKAREQSKVTAAAQKAYDFLQANPEIADWLPAAADRGFGFAKSMADALVRYGSWTENQHAAVLRCIESDKARAAERAAREQAALTAAGNSTPPVAAGLDLSKIPAGMYAVPEGETRLKVKIQKPTDGKWAGFIFVSDGAEYGQRTRYGMQKPGGRYVGKIEDQLRAIMANPREAMAAYGHLVGRCGVCGRLLEDEVSVANGIGPVCAGRMGW